MEINVTPESDVPIIPKATMYHGERRLARKKVCESVFLPVKKDIKIRMAKYATMIPIISDGDMKIPNRCYRQI